MNDLSIAVFGQRKFYPNSPRCTGHQCMIFNSSHEKDLLCFFHFVSSMNKQKVGLKDYKKS